LAYMSEDHLLQMLQQCIVLNANFGMYVCTAETGLLYTLLIYFSQLMLIKAENVLEDTLGSVLEWAHVSDSATPPNVLPWRSQLPRPPCSDRELSALLLSKHKFWSVVNSYVSRSGPLPPVKVFKHSLQSYYSRTKGGVDGVTQARALLRTSTTNLGWEQKIVSQVLKTVIVNAFVAWRMSVREDLVETSESFKSVDRYRQILNNVQPLGDFVLDLCKEMLLHAKILRHIPDESRISEEKVVRLSEQARRRKRNRLEFFNTEDGRALRLSLTQRHEQLHESKPHWCVLCGQNFVTADRNPTSMDAGVDRGELHIGHRSSFKCTLCDVHLCVRVFTGSRKSCWNLWHSQRQVMPRLYSREVKQREEQAESSFRISTPQSSAQELPHATRRKRARKNSTYLSPEPRSISPQSSHLPSRPELGTILKCGEPGCSLPPIGATSAHKCPDCACPMHAICGSGVGDEGYGQPRRCARCLRGSTSGIA
jgi:hypothetical protein